MMPVKPNGTSTYCLVDLRVLKIDKVELVSLLGHFSKWYSCILFVYHIFVHHNYFRKGHKRKLNRALTLTCTEMTLSSRYVLPFKYLWLSPYHSPFVLIFLIYCLYFKHFLPTVITAVVSQLVAILLNMLQGLRMGAGPYPHHVIGYVLYVAV
jgi:hypothetical protein